MVQGFFRRNNAIRVVCTLKEVREYLLKCCPDEGEAVDYRAVVRAVIEIHAGSDFSNSGLLDNPEELFVATNWLFKHLGLSARSIRYTEQWVTFAVSNIPDLAEHGMGEFEFLAWFFQEFVLVPHAKVTLSLPENHFGRKEELEKYAADDIYTKHKRRAPQSKLLQKGAHDFHKDRAMHRRRMGATGGLMTDAEEAYHAAFHNSGSHSGMLTHSEDSAQPEGGEGTGGFDPVVHPSTNGRPLTMSEPQGKSVAWQAPLPTSDPVTPEVQR